MHGLAAESDEGMPSVIMSRHLNVVGSAMWCLGGGAGLTVALAWSDAILTASSLPWLQSMTEVHVQGLGQVGWYRPFATEVCILFTVGGDHAHEDELVECSWDEVKLLRQVGTLRRLRNDDGGRRGQDHEVSTTAPARELPVVVTRHHSSGWPLRALEWRGRYAIDTMATNATVETATLDGGIALTARPLPGDCLYRMRALPVKPLAVGFVVDTLFWGGMLAVVLGSAQSLLRRWRVSRSRCARCSYHVVAQMGGRCSECGEKAGAAECKRGKASG